MGLANALSCAHGVSCQHHGHLPFTGLNLTLVALAAIALLVLGTALYRAGRG